MKITGYILLMMIGGIETAVAQKAGQKLIAISGGIGVSAHSAPSIVDYVNAIAQPPFGQQADEFSASTEFFIAPEYQIDDAWSIGAEYSYHLKSYGFDNSGSLGRSEFTHRVHMPTLIVHYLVPGERYWFKVGGGIGLHSGSFETSLPAFGQSWTMRGTGFAAKVEAIGNTGFDEHFYGSIGVDLRWAFGGAFKGSEAQSAGSLSSKPSMSFFSAGLKFGVMFVL